MMSNYKKRIFTITLCTLLMIYFPILSLHMNGYASQSEPANKEQIQQQARAEAMRFFQSGEQFLKDYNYAQAAAQFKEGLRIMSEKGDVKDPDYARYYQRYEEAIAKDRQIKELLPEITKVAMDERPLTTGTIEKALKDVDVILSLKPNHTDAQAYKSKLGLKLESTQRANRLWSEGTDFFSQNKLAEALTKFKESLKYWSNDERIKYVRDLETRKSQAQRLRAEGETLQNKGKWKEAIVKYQDSLKYWPDPALDEHMDKIKNQIATAERLWEEGSDLIFQRQYSDALIKLKDSLKYLVDAERSRYVQELENRRNHSFKLKDEGTLLENQGKSREAIAKYEESLQYWPDSYLEQQVRRLKTDLDKRIMADQLWSEGHTLYESRHLNEALSKFQESLKYWSNTERSNYAQELENKKSQSLRLRDEGASLENQWKYREAITKYRESLRLWPDYELEQNIQTLEVKVASGKADEERCDHYTQIALAQNQENLNRNCRLSGEGWTSDYRTHFQWCLSVSQSVIDSETKYRAEQLKNCIVLKATEERCEQYAKMAVTHSQENHSMDCGFHGDRWTSHYRNHYQWCLNTTPSLVDAETRFRAEQLRNCIASKKANEDRCDQYAKVAVAQNQANLLIGCGFIGGQWTSDYSAHYNWCLKASPLIANSETRSRAEQIQRCRLEKRHPPSKKEVVIFNNGNTEGGKNNPTRPTTFSIDQPHHITRIQNYHWNNGRGAKPGKISLKDRRGQIHGPWQTVGDTERGKVPNTNWTCYPNIVIPAGSYTIIDSDPNTWSQNAGSKGEGFSKVEGYPQ